MCLRHSYMCVSLTCVSARHRWHVMTADMSGCDRWHHRVADTSLVTWQTEQNSEQWIAQFISAITQLSATVLHTSIDRRVYVTSGISLGFCSQTRRQHSQRCQLHNIGSRRKNKGSFTFWISLIAERNRYVYSQASRSIYRGIYMSSNSYYLLLFFLSRKEQCRQIGLQTSNRDIFMKL